MSESAPKCSQIDKFIEEFENFLKELNLNATQPKSVFVHSVVLEAFIRRNMTLDRTFLDKIESIAKKYGLLTLDVKVYLTKNDYWVFIEIKPW
jgi:uncharacterized protein YjbK